jgi:phage baseplate assembly protein W
MATAPTFYKDLSLNLTPNPITGDTPPATNEAAVKKALINLIRTPLGTKPFSPDYGTKVYDYLFAPADSSTESDINDEINRCIERFEPRVKVASITTNMDGDGIEIIVNYYVTTISNAQQTLTTTITRTS